MEPHSEQTSIGFEIKPLTRAETTKEIVRGIGVALGLTLFWVLELVRDAYFRLLDMAGVKARRKKRASAFPPGRPKIHRHD